MGVCKLGVSGWEQASLEDDQAEEECEDSGHEPARRRRSPVCVELGQFGKEEEVERLRRDRDVLMAEILKLKQQQSSSRERLVVIEERVRGSERKQQMITSFVSKAFANPLFVEHLVDGGGRRVELGQKRRLTAAGGTSLNPITDDVLERLLGEDEAGENVAPDQSE